ncbi:hypothetical protein [Hafnia phage yong3]|nr:hypothetical protein [Hafnia phage yong3]
MKSVIEALLDLDPENPNHWTDDGMPKVNAVKFATGNPQLTREDITAVAPDFTRDNRVVPEAEPVQPVQSADPVLHEQLETQAQEQEYEQTQKANIVEEIKDKIAEALYEVLGFETVPDFAQRSDAELKAALSRREEAVKELDKVKAAVDSIRNDQNAIVDSMILELEDRAPKSSLTATQLYLRAQANRTAADLRTDNQFLNPVDDPVSRLVTRLQRSGR